MKNMIHHVETTNRFENLGKVCYQPLVRLLSLLFGLAWISPLPIRACDELCSFAYNTGFGDDTLVSVTSGTNNTAFGNNALLNDTSGSFNTGLGSFALISNQTGHDNTAVGHGAMYGDVDTTPTGSYNTVVGSAAMNFYTSATENTATGYLALYLNVSGSRNVATGAYALHQNRTGADNTATGMNALYNNTGNYNTAHGYQALESNTTGANNTASGLNALNLNTHGSNNAADGAYALYSNTMASNNTAQGYKALYSNSLGTANTADGEIALYQNTSGSYNTAIGVSALYGNTIGARNIAVGYGAGFNLTTGSNNIDIGHLGVAGDSNAIRIGTPGTQANAYVAGISGVPVAGGVGVIVDTNGHLGTVVSSGRFKDDVRKMDKASEAILSLQPVTFRYKKELDPASIPQFGLVAEEVEKVNPDLVVRDEQGRPYSVRYEAVSAMLLNEFLKEHRKVESLQATAAQQESTNIELKEEIKLLKTTLKEQTAQIQEVRNQLNPQDSARHVVANN